MLSKIDFQLATFTRVEKCRAQIQWPCLSVAKVVMTFGMRFDWPKLSTSFATATLALELWCRWTIAGADPANRSATVEFDYTDEHTKVMTDIDPQTRSTSQSLLKRAQAKEPEAWDRLVRIYTPLIYSWIRRAGIAEHDAADVVQEVLGSLPRGLINFEPSAGSFRSYLGGITRNKTNDLLRQQMSDKEPQLIPVEWIAEMADVSQTPGRASQTDQLLANRALELIKTDFRFQTWQAFWRTAVLGENANDVAADLKMKIGSVYTARSRVLAKLRTELAGML